MLWRLITTGLLFCATSVIFTLMNEKQPEPYMDEIFHIPQAQNYCHNNYNHWNNKITTLPGLYFFSQIPLSIYSWVVSQPLKDYCSAYLLRLTNAAFIIACFYLFSEISRALQFKKVNKSGVDVPSDLKVHSNALVLTLFPLLYFFTFLYYTDVGSTFFVFLGYYLSLLDCHVTSAAVGCVAVLFRQTNIIWVGFSAAVSIIRYLVDKKQYSRNDNLLMDILSTIKGCLVYWKDVLKIGVPYVLVLLLFIAFVLINNGIVVGDRSMHVASFNLPQIFYFSAFVAFFSCFLILRYIHPDRCRKIIRSISLMKIFTFLLVAGIMFLAIHKFTYVHKYLLADNRHYTFYIWRKLLDRHWCARYILIPVYLVSWMVIFNELSMKCNQISILAFFLCVCATLVPQKLLEFRYFIVPYLFFRLHIRIPNYLELFLEFLLYVCVNAVTIYLYLYRPFYWPSDDSVQRFMW